ncbi:ABC transporter permease subunit [Dactylosporangium sp. NPDC051541]|uniref:ABC transporter permease subunit n=1 Tax=Dactylosporangium sp. NPDC051541 TaxID=3363977 RepID=UPI003788B371
MAAGLIIPPAATPTGVFLLRQYMLGRPDELIEAARIDGAGEFRFLQRHIARGIAGTGLK